MDKIELVSVGATVSIVPDDGGWSQVVLLLDDRSVALGAERVAFIAGKIVAFMRQRSSGLKWVLSLSEQHCSIYGEYVEDKVLLRIQDANATMLATVELTEDQRQQWIGLLRSSLG